MSIFTRRALREIVLELTREQEQGIIDLYLRSTQSLIKTIKQMEKKYGLYREGKNYVTF